MSSINFLSGFYRSGSTLLTVLLNQHPEIYCSHQSDLSSVLSITQESFNGLESYIAGNATHRYYQMLEKMSQNFYSDINKNIILDKSRAWGHPDSFKFMHMINSKYKIIFTYRPVLDILSSFILINRKNPDNIFMKNFIESKHPSLYFKDKEDAFCDYLVTSFLEPGIRNLSLLKNNQNEETLFLLNYNDLVNNTQHELDKIYKFLGLNSFSNDINYIVDSEEPNDSYFGAPIHKISNRIDSNIRDNSLILSKYVINRYSELFDGIL